MSFVSSFEAEVEAIVLKVLEKLGLHKTPTPDAGGGQQPTAPTNSPTPDAGQQPPTQAP